MSTYFTAVTAHTTFAEAKYTKADLARGAHLLAGLNCFEPGQSQAVHAHEGADKFYLVLEGKARMRVGAEEVEAGPGRWSGRLPGCRTGWWKRWSDASCW